MLGGRSRPMVAREILRVRNYRALLRMARVYPELGQAVRRYFLGRGELPYSCPVRTPAGVVAPTLYSSHDMFTVNEIFCREDYRTGPGARTVVDVGSNIGLSALYFLTRDPHTRCALYEPVPRNVERLRLNLAAYEDRYTLHEVAVAAAPGPVSFGVEDTGRYGGIGVATERTIEVRSVGINDVLEHALEEADRIDVLKIDTEGTELEILAAARPDLLGRVRTVYLETADRRGPELESFSTSFRNDTLVLENRAA
jgi:FkbM family methyltransferase